MFEKNLKDELFACHNYIKIPFDVLNRMPVRDRKYYIHKYNEYMEAKNEAMSGNNTKSTMDISHFTNLSQGLTGDDALDT